MSYIGQTNKPPFKFGVRVIFFMFLKGASFAHTRLYLFNQKYSGNSYSDKIITI